MNRLLDVPWVVNEESERISTHGGLGSIDFNGAEKERREAMRLVAQTQAMVHALLIQATTNRDGEPCFCAPVRVGPDPHEARCEVARTALRASGVLR